MCMRVGGVWTVGLLVVIGMKAFPAFSVYVQKSVGTEICAVSVSGILKSISPSQLGLSN